MLAGYTVLHFILLKIHLSFYLFIFILCLPFTSLFVIHIIVFVLLKRSFKSFLREASCLPTSVFVLTVQVFSVHAVLLSLHITSFVLLHSIVEHFEKA